MSFFNYLNIGIKKMNLILKGLKGLYPNFPDINESSESTTLDIVHDCFISDYANVYNFEMKLNFPDFVNKLMRFANQNSVRSIKQIFDDKDFINELDSEGNTLYIIAKATYNEKKYTVKSTSKDKYHTNNYIVSIS